ncbi:Transcription activator AMTR1 [Fusarium oxysporum f. sp. albedinis]|nr:Transcription activator AMTR1 [Fusarium oxysporum f. sp. albedinis]
MIILAIDKPRRYFLKRRHKVLSEVSTHDVFVLVRSMLFCDDLSSRISPALHHSINLRISPSPTRDIPERTSRSILYEKL